MSNYDLFFEALNEMQTEHQLSADEKKDLKSKMVSEDIYVMEIIKQTSIKTMKDKIIEYLKKEQVVTTPKKSESSISKYKDSNDSIREEYRAKTNSSDSINTEEQTLDSITDKLEKILLSIQLEKKTFSIYEKKNLQKIKKQVESLIEQKINNLKKNDIVQIVQRTQPKILQQYNFFKEQIILSLRQILQFNVSEIKLSPLLQIMQKFLELTIGYTHFSYLYEKEENAFILFDSFKEINVEISKENNQNMKTMIENLVQNKYCTFTQEEQNNNKDLDLFSNYKQTNYIKIFLENQQKNLVFFVHKLENDKKGLSLEYYFIFLFYSNSLLDFQLQDNYFKEQGFLYYQILQAHKMNLFTPFIFTSQYLDLLNLLLDNSIFYFLWELKNALKDNLNQEIEIEEIQQYQNEDQNSLVFKFLKKSYIINQNNIALEVDFPNNLELVNIFNRYKKQVQKFKNKTKIYKKFIKNPTKLMLDFDKKNVLIFLSQPLSVEMRQKFHIPADMDIFEDTQRLDTIFAKNPKLLEDIKETKQKINKLSFQNNFIQSYHIPEIDFYFEFQNHKIRHFNLVINDLDIFYERLSMSQALDRSISGSPSQNQNSSHIQDSFMTLSQIDEENDELTEIQKQKIQRRISKVINYSQTAKLLKNLQNEDPSIKDSQIQLFLPEDHSVKKSDNQITKQVKFQLQEDDKKNKIKFDFDIGIFQHKENDTNFLNLDWNALECQTVQEMQRTAWAILDQGGWIEKMQIEAQTLLDFLQMMEGKYNQRKNTFHNYQHGIAVMQGCYGLSKGTSISKFLCDFETFALTFSGLCHDVNHTGRTNIFEVNSLSKLAIRYQDQSVLENHHLANTFKCLSHHNVFKNIPEQQFLELRKIMISNILYTDIKKHFSLIKDFENSFKLVTEDKKQIENSIIPQPERIYGKTPEEVRLLTGMVIHTADFVGGAKQFNISRVWSERVNVEFAAQYEEEFKLGIAQTPYFKDLDKIQVVAKGEIGFYKFIVLPLWSLLNDFLYGEIHKNVNYLQEAISEWTKIMEQNQEKEIKNDEKK